MVAAAIAVHVGGVQAAGMTVNASDWTGIYLGLGGGYGWGETSVVPTTIPPAFSENPGSLKGGFVSLELSANKQIKNTVFGVLADISMGDMRAESTYSEEGDLSTWSTHTNFVASVRGLLGQSFGRVLPYVTAGMAFANTETVWTYENGSLPTSTTGRGVFGWTIGAGVEVALHQNWSLQGDYLYARFASVNDPAMPMDDEGPSFGGTIQTNVSLIKFTLKHKFGT